MLTILEGDHYQVSGFTLNPTLNFVGQLFVSVIVNDGVNNSDPFEVSISGKDIVGSVAETNRAEESITLKNEELQKINIELDRFVYSASHDLRATIFFLLGLIEVARLEKEPSKIENLLKMQKRSLLKLDSFISDIVSYSRSNRLQLEVEKIDFQILQMEIFDQLHFREQLRQLRISIRVDEDFVFHGDRKRISIVLNNLITNAIKYSDPSKEVPFIEVVVEKSNQGVAIRAIDNGEGIDENNIQKIFANGLKFD